MKTTINFYQFAEAFRDLRPDNFSREALVLLFDYFEELEADIGEEIEFDCIGICCDYCEDTFEGIIDNYSINVSDCEDEDARADTVLEFLNDHTQVLGLTDAGDSVVYAVF